MILFVAGDVHGELTKLYDSVRALEQRLKVKADWLLQTGNLGAFPDPHRIDRALRQKNRQVDFHEYYMGVKEIPIPTLFVPGKHEDHRWLNFMASKNQLELIPNLTLLLNGYKTYIGNGYPLSVVGLGRAYSPKTYAGVRGPKSSSQYTRREVERGCSQGPVDILLTHEAGHSAHLGNHLSPAEGINSLASAVRPFIHFHGHYDFSKYYKHPKTNRASWALAFGEVKALDWQSENITFLD